MPTEDHPANVFSAPGPYSLAVGDLLHVTTTRAGGLPPEPHFWTIDGVHLGGTGEESLVTMSRADGVASGSTSLGPQHTCVVPLALLRALTEQGDGCLFTPSARL